MGVFVTATDALDLKNLVDQARIDRRKNVMVVIDVDLLATLIQNDVRQIPHCDKNWNGQNA